MRPNTHRYRVVQCHNVFGVSLTPLKLGLPESRRSDMFDSKMLLVILAIALVIFGTKRLRSIGSDLGAAVKGFKQAMNDGESEEKVKQLKQEKDADFEAGAASRESEVKAPPKTNT